MMISSNSIGLEFSEKELLRGCAAGKREYQEYMYSHYSPKMFGICLRYAGDYHSAEDILQDGFIKVFGNLDRYRGEGSFEGWLKRIFVNTAIEHYRKQFRFESTTTNLESSTATMEIPDDTFGRLAANELLDLIQKLSPGYRAVFNMYVLEGFSHKEISDILKISEGTSKSQLARARTILQKLVSEKV